MQLRQSLFTQIFGWGLAELKGKRIPFVPESEKSATMALINDLMQNGTPCRNYETNDIPKKGNSGYQRECLPL